MKLKILIPVILLLAACSTAYGQYFEGELDFNNSYIDPKTWQKMFNDIPQTISLKNGNSKLAIINPEPGQLNWQIDNYETGQRFVFTDYTNSKVPILDHPPVFKDGKLVLTPNDTPYISKIYEQKLCRDSILIGNNYLDGLKKLDTIIYIAGLSCKVFVDMVNGFRVGEYYYTDSIKLNPMQYNCPRLDGDDRLYKFTNGSLIVSRLIFNIDAYVYGLQLQAVRWKKLSDDVFELPKSLLVVKLKK